MTVLEEMKARLQREDDAAALHYLGRERWKAAMWFRHYSSDPQRILTEFFGSR